MSEGYRPREHDHLVEPFFEGLGAGPDGEEQEGATTEREGPAAPSMSLAKRLCWVGALLLLVALLLLALAT